MIDPFVVSLPALAEAEAGLAVQGFVPVPVSGSRGHQNRIP